MVVGIRGNTLKQVRLPNVTSFKISVSRIIV